MNIKPTTSRTAVDAHSVVRYHAKVEWYVQAGTGDAYVCYSGWEQCPHDHLDPASAEKCRLRLMWRIEHKPDQFPKIVQAIDAAMKQQERAEYAETVEGHKPDCDGRNCSHPAHDQGEDK